MNVLEARVNWYEGYANNPELQVLVDEIPKRADLEYHMIQADKHGVMYHADKDGYVSFMYECFTDRAGYGGRSFNITVHADTPEGGTMDVEVVGPWSSRAGVINHIFRDKPENHCVEVTMTDDPIAWERRYTFMSGAINLSLAIEALDLIRDPSKLPIILEKLDEMERAKPGTESWTRQDITYIPRRELARNYLLPNSDKILEQAYEVAYAIIGKPLKSLKDRTNPKYLLDRIDNHFTKYYGTKWKEIILDGYKQPERQ